MKLGFAEAARTGLLKELSVVEKQISDNEVLQQGLQEIIKERHKKREITGSQEDFKLLVDALEDWAKLRSARRTFEERLQLIKSKLEVPKVNDAVLSASQTRELKPIKAEIFKVENLIFEISREIGLLKQKGGDTSALYLALESYQTQLRALRVSRDAILSRKEEPTPTPDQAQPAEAPLPPFPKDMGMKEKGVPQGAATSCSLSTINLHKLLVEESKNSVGYADDGLIFPSDPNIDPVKYLEERTGGVEVNETKSR